MTVSEQDGTGEVKPETFTWVESGCGHSYRAGTPRDQGQREREERGRGRERTQKLASHKWERVS